MQIKITLKLNFTPVRATIIKNTNNKRYWQGYRGKGAHIHCWWEYEIIQPLWKTTYRLLKKIKIELPNDPVIIGSYLKESKSGYNCTPMFIAAFFTIL
jgi:hypothetical protein